MGRAPLSSTDHRTGLLLATGSVALMSLTPTINKLALQSIGPVEAAVVSGLWSAAFATAVCIPRREASLRLETPSLAIAGISNGLGPLCLFESLARLNPGPLGLSRFYIVFAMLLAVTAGRERPHRTHIALSALAIAGLFILVPFDSNASASGAILALLYTFFFAVCNLAIKIGASASSATRQLFITNVYALVFLLPYALWVVFATSQRNNDHSARLLRVAWHFAGLWLYYVALRRISYYTSNIIRASSPLWVALWAWPFFPVTIGWRESDRSPADRCACGQYGVPFGKAATIAAIHSDSSFRCGLSEINSDAAFAPSRHVPRTLHPP